MILKIEGYFPSIKEANEAIKQLQKAGHKTSYLDLKDEYEESRNININLAGTETAPSLSNLVLGSGGTVLEDRSKAPAAAADPMVSGMANMEEITDINSKIVVELDNKSNSRDVERIIKEMGGTLENPDVKKPRITGDADRVFEIAMNRLNNKRR